MTLRRTELRRKTPMKRGSSKLGGQGSQFGGSGSKSRRPLPAKSAKRAAEDAFDGARARTRNTTHDRARYTCVAHQLVPGVPCGEGVQCDEIQGRGRQPGSHLDDTATQSLCSWCHRLKTDFPRIAGLLGLYGPDEQERRIAEEPDGCVTVALAEWARRKAQAQGYTRDVGGSTDAVERLAAASGASIPERGW